MYDSLESKLEKLDADKMRRDESVQRFMMNARKTNRLNNCILKRLQKVAVIFREAWVTNLHNNMN